MSLTLRPLPTNDETALPFHDAVRLLLPLTDHKCLYQGEKSPPCRCCRVINQLKKTGAFQVERKKYLPRLRADLFGENLVKILKEKNIRKLHLSNRTRMNRVTIDQVIRGNNPRLQTIVKILNELTDVTLEDLTS